MSDVRPVGIRRSYDRVAKRYAERFERELARKPFDRNFLDRVAALTPPGRLVVDLGSGPGQIGAYLSARGLRVACLDLSFPMVEQAGARNADAVRLQADMRSLPFADGSLASALAFYSLVHIPPEQLERTLAELFRALAPNGLLAVTAHVAPPDGAPLREGVMYVDEMLSEPVDLEFHFYEADRLARALERLGFDLVECTEREPYAPDVEAQTRRAYVLARKRV